MNIYTKVINPHHFLASMSLFQRLFGRREPKQEDKPIQSSPVMPAERTMSTAITDKYPSEVSDSLNPYLPLVQNMISELREKTEKSVPEVGEFKIVYTEFHNPDPKLEVTDFILKVTKPPKSVTGHERRRYLEFVAYNVPSPYICEKVIAAGEKHEILAALDDANLPQRLIDLIPQMERDLRLS